MLEEHRREIDRVNREIADSVAERLEIVDNILEVKKENDMEIVDNGREEKVKQQFENLFSERDLPEEKGRELASMLIEIATEHQEEKL